MTSHEPKAGPQTNVVPMALFEPVSLGGLDLPNRLVMAPMTRSRSPGGVPSADVASYYARRAEGGVGLIITEGCWIDHANAGNDPAVPRFYGEDALAGWAIVRERVQATGARIMPQLWHVGQLATPAADGDLKTWARNARMVGPSGMVGAPGQLPELLSTPMTQADIDEVVNAYASAAHNAFRLGFDGVELHAAHGYLIDQFFWPQTNLRTDQYGGSAPQRARFAAEIVAEIKRRTSSDFPVSVRISHWKAHDYEAMLTQSPSELEALLGPIVDAGADFFHCSQRRFWDPAFPDSGANLAAWVRKLTGRPTITVGSVALQHDFIASFLGEYSETTNLDALFDRFADGEFDLVAIGRSLIADPDWPRKLAQGRIGEFVPFDPKMLETLA